MRALHYYNKVQKFASYDDTYHIYYIIIHLLRSFVSSAIQSYTYNDQNLPLTLGIHNNIIKNSILIIQQRTLQRSI